MGQRRSLWLDLFNKEKATFLLASGLVGMSLYFCFSSSTVRLIMGEPLTSENEVPSVPAETKFEDIPIEFYVQSGIYELGNPKTKVEVNRKRKNPFAPVLPTIEKPKLPSDHDDSRRNAKEGISDPPKQFFENKTAIISMEETPKIEDWKVYGTAYRRKDKSRYAFVKKLNERDGVVLQEGESLSPNELLKTIEWNSVIIQNDDGNVRKSKIMSW